MTNPLISEIVAKVRTDGVIKKAGLLQFELAGISIEIDNKDIVGGVLQSWFGEWLKVHGYEYLNSATQTFPDFEFNGDIYLELKTFNSEKCSNTLISQKESRCIFPARPVNTHMTLIWITTNVK